MVIEILIVHNGLHHLYGIAPNGSYGVCFGVWSRGTLVSGRGADRGADGVGILNDAGSGPARGKTADVRGGTRGSVAIGESELENADRV